ncbi:MAG TPA: hemolysin family protein [Anaerolineales bacterium]|nr:hemolysin family protein [Anaerolineales bacterium]
MNEDIPLTVIFVVFLALDLALIVVRAAYLNTNHARLLSLRSQMERPVNRALQVLLQDHRLEASLNAFLLIIHIVLASLAAIWLSRILTGPLIVSGVILAAGIVFIWIEAGIERLVAKSADIWAVRLAWLAEAVQGTAGILIWPLGLSNEPPEGIDPSGNVTETELMTLVDAGREEGIFEQVEQEMIQSVIQLHDTLAREIMVPRIDMLALDVDTPLEEAVDAFLRSGHSRAPVFEETVDNTLGLMYAKDLLRVWREGNPAGSLRDLLRPAYFVPEAKRVDELLTEMQDRSIHMAIVVDEYGGVAGLVTMEDIVEEIVGEIRDEYDQSEEAPFQTLNESDTIFQGRVHLDDFNEIMLSNLPSEEADTIGGFIYSRLGRVPMVGETVEEAGLVLTVEQVSGRRIRKVRAHRVPDEQADGEEKRHVNG